jgi:hypothetical protein
MRINARSNDTEIRLQITQILCGKHQFAKQVGSYLCFIVQG